MAVIPFHGRGMCWAPGNMLRDGPSLGLGIPKQNLPPDGYSSTRDPNFFLPAPGVVIFLVPHCGVLRSPPVRVVW